MRGYIHIVFRCRCHHGCEEHALPSWWKIRTWFWCCHHDDSRTRLCGRDVPPTGTCPSYGAAFLSISSGSKWNSGVDDWQDCRCNCLQPGLQLADVLRFSSPDTTVRRQKTSHSTSCLTCHVLKLFITRVQFCVVSNSSEHLSCWTRAEFLWQLGLRSPLAVSVVLHRGEHH